MLDLEETREEAEEPALVAMEATKEERARNEKRKREEEWKQAQAEAKRYNY